MSRLIALLLLALSAIALPARAHLAPNSEIALTFGPADVRAVVTIPLGELGYATGAPIPSAPPPGRSAAPPGLVAYVAQRIAARAPDGSPWRVTVLDAAVVGGPAPDLVATVRLAPPPGAPLRRFDLAYSAVIDRVSNHFVLVYEAAEPPRLIGGLQAGARTLAVDRTPGAAWRSFRSSVGLGMHHIAEGHDHLLFLLALLLPAPLFAARARWGGPAGLRATGRRLTAVITAFTIGHSLTLIGGAVFGWRLPAQPVEVLIAVSILVSAVHAWRPIFAGREPLVAGGFGLVHGLAFATLVGALGLGPWQKAQAILGFNIGIELVQLAVAAVAAPLLVVLSRTRAYPPIRNALAAFAAVAAVAWIVERLLETPNPVAAAIDAGLTHWPWAALILAATTAAAVLADRGRAVRPT